MTNVVVFPSDLGVRAGIVETSERLTAAGHDVLVVDVLEGRTFDDYPSAIAHNRSQSVEERHSVASAALEAVRDSFFTVGFSSGCELAEWSLAQRPADARGAVLVAGVIPMRYVEASWPAGVPVQTHATRQDPLGEGQEFADEFRREVETAGGTVEEFAYDGSGHLFNDPSLAAEFQPDDAEQLYARVLAFLSR